MNMKLKRIAINFAVFACFASSVFAGDYEFSGGFPTQETIQKARTIPIQFSLGEGLDIGQDVGSPVNSPPTSCRSSSPEKLKKCRSI